ncbi:hypothetical protein [Natronospora cellulosivora (SeqCode)]
MSVIILIKKGLPNLKQILISFFLASIMFIAYQGISVFSVRIFLVLFLSSMATLSISNKYQSNGLKFLNTDSVKSIFFTICIGLIIGIVLGIVNLFLSSETLEFQFNILAFTIALSPAILEEIAYRALIYSFCLYLLKGEVNTKLEKFTCYFMMIVPHVVIHLPDIFLENVMLNCVCQDKFKKQD